MVDRHTIAQHARNEFSIVPILRVELLRESFDGGLVSALVLELEVVAAFSVRLYLLDNLTLVTVLGRAIPSSSSCRPVNIS